MTHSSEISIPHATVWEEHIDGAGKNRTYTTAAQPIKPLLRTSIAMNKTSKSGASVIRFNLGSTLLATKSDTMLSTVWIWSLSSMIAYAVLLQHAPVRSIEWHPTISDLLLIDCATVEPILHVWKESWDTPKIISVPKALNGDKLEASWIYTPNEEPVKILLANTLDSAVVQLSYDGDIMDVPQAQQEPSQELGPDNRFDEGHSMDFSAVKLPDNDTAKFAAQDHSDIWQLSDEMDDTFHFKHHQSAAVNS